MSKGAAPKTESMKIKYKCLFDIFASFSAIILALPILLIIYLLIKLTSKGPAIFKQTRAGKNEQPFTLYKFRTMKMDVDPFGASPKSQDDPRLIKYGKFLREYSLDELPQLFNVLKGDMSIVGPRPFYMEQVAQWNDYHRQLLQIKPGLTGMAQVSGRGALTHEAKLDIEVKYLKHKNIRRDLMIIFRTFAVVLTKEGIYEKRYSKKEHTRGEQHHSQ